MAHKAAVLPCVPLSLLERPQHRHQGTGDLARGLSAVAEAGLGPCTLSGDLSPDRRVRGAQPS